MKFKYLFSVITVCYNASCQIQKTVESVLKQKCKDYEYLIIDGASTDDTVKKVRQYQNDFEERLKIYVETDSGIFDAMNKGILNAKGEYLIFINADDELCESALSIIRDYLLSSKHRPDIIYGDCFVVYCNGNKSITKLKKAYSHIDMRTLKNGMGIIHQSMLTRKTLFDEIGIFHQEYSIGADWDFLIRSVKAQASIQYIPVPISRFMTNGISSHVHNIQRHKIRKDNRLYKIIDINLIKDLFNVGTMLQLLIGEKEYQKIRYFINKFLKK